MNSVFTITCKACGCKMEFKPAKHPPISPITCQNCGQELQDIDHTALSRAMHAIEALPYETMEDEGYVPPKKGFKISLSVLPPALIEQED